MRFLAVNSVQHVFAWVYTIALNNGVFYSVFSRISVFKKNKEATNSDKQHVQLTPHTTKNQAPRRHNGILS